MAPYQDHMLAVLREEEMQPYLTGGMRHFEPACEKLQVRETANPRTRKKEPPPASEQQGELF